MSRWSLLLAASLLMATPALAKKKKPAPAPTAATKSDKKNDDKVLPPGDKSANDGAQGRRNATEDAARAADSPQFEHRP